MWPCLSTKRPLEGEGAKSSFLHLMSNRHLHLYMFKLIFWNNHHLANMFLDNSILSVALDSSLISLSYTQHLQHCQISLKKYPDSHHSQFTSVQSLSRVRLSATLWIAAHQASLSITNSQSSRRLTSIESVMPSSHLILCRPLLLLPPIPPRIRVFSDESTLRMRWPKYWSLSFSITATHYLCYYHFGANHAYLQPGL